MSFADEVAGMFPAFKAAGMLCIATDDDGDFDVDFRRPVRIISESSLSNEYEIEYQSKDRTLREGDTLTISGAADPNDDGEYRVRQAPDIVAPGNAADGTFRCALLTKL